MKLSVRQTAEIFGVSEKTIYRWIAQGKIPAYRINDQYRFNRTELLEWATSRRVSFSPRLMEEAEEDAFVPSLESALREGGIYYRLEGADKPAVLRSVVEAMPLPEECDREFLLQVLLARESAGSTAIGGGLAIPHPRNPIVLHIARPLVSLCFLEHPVDFGALDGIPVHALFVILSPTIKTHLGFLSRLVFALRDMEFLDVIARQSLRDEIFQQARRLDGSIAMHEPRKGLEPQ